MNSSFIQSCQVNLRNVFHSCYIFFLPRFGKRAPMRFGKRAPMRFGKRDELDDLNEMYEFLPAHNELSYPYEQ